MLPRHINGTSKRISGNTPFVLWAGPSCNRKSPAPLSLALPSTAALDSLGKESGSRDCALGTPSQSCCVTPLASRSIG